MPAEWKPHVATWLAFPHHRTDFPGKLGAVIHTFSEMARVITEGERLRFLVQSRAEEERAAAIFADNQVDLSQVDFVRQPTNRSWLRDTMPLWVQKQGQPALAVKFRFNGWARYRDYQKDDEAGVQIARRFAKLRAYPEDGSRQRIVLEGGSIDVDDAGTLLTTRECLVTSPRARFPGGYAAAEAALTEYLGIKKVLWLPTGIVGDDTSGHVDDFARFAPGAKVLLCEERRRSDPNFAPLAEARRALVGATSASGRPLQIVPLPMPRAVFYRGDRLPASYANFYVCNAAVLVPVFNDPADKDALAIIAECFKDRPVVGIYARDLVVGLGTLHCSTMQEVE